MPSRKSNPATATPTATAPVPIDFRQAQEDLRARLRVGMLNEATRLLDAEGPQALTVRRIAVAVNCSTTLLYRLFGGKDGLANELYLEGLARLQQRYAQLPADLTPLQRVRALGLAYRAFALDNPAYYMIMFGDAIAGFVPPIESRRKAWASLAILIEALEACMATGVLRQSDAKTAARLLWAAQHGTVSLELKGYYLKTERASELYDAGIEAILNFYTRRPA